MNSYRVAQDVQRGHLSPDEAVVLVLTGAERDHRDALDEVVLLATYLGELLQAPPNPVERTSDALSSPERDLGGDGGHNVPTPDTAPTGNGVTTTENGQAPFSHQGRPGSPVHVVRDCSIEEQDGKHGPVGAAKGAARDVPAELHRRGGKCPHGERSWTDCWRCCETLHHMEKDFDTRKGDAL